MGRSKMPAAGFEVFKFHAIFNADAAMIFRADIFLAVYSASNIELLPTS